MTHPSGAMLRHYKHKAEADLKRKRKRHANQYPVLDDYVLLDEIGRGAFGEVRLALNLETMERVAVKVILKDLVRTKMSTANVKREIRCMQELRHPNVVRLLDVYSTRSTIYMMMELVTGGELFSEVAYFGRLSEEYARFFFQQLVRGLEYCHSRGIFHRDLKPDNILLDGDKTLKITDFGLSFIRDDDTSKNTERMLHTACGTPNYIAPEVVVNSSKGYKGDKADAWSVGCILYVMVTGFLPFDGTALVDIFRQVALCDVAYPEHLSEDLVDLLERIFEYDPTSRLSLAQISRHRWFNGPVCTTMPGDQRNKSDTVDQMATRIQEVVKSYMVYKQTSTAQKNKGNGKVYVPPPTSTVSTTAEKSLKGLHNYAEKGNYYDSLAIGWLNNSEIGLRGSSIMAGGKITPPSNTGSPPSMHVPEITATARLPPSVISSFQDRPPLPVKSSLMDFNKAEKGIGVLEAEAHDTTNHSLSVKPNSEEISRVKELLRQNSFTSDGTTESSGSSRFPNGSDDEDCSEIENVNGLHKNLWRSKTTLKGRGLRRSRSAASFSLRQLSSMDLADKEFEGFVPGQSTNDANTRQRVRLQLWDDLASEMRGESTNTESSESANEQCGLPQLANIRRRELVKSQSHEGLFESNSPKKRLRNRAQREKLRLSPSDSAHNIATSRRRRRGVVEAPSPLANSMSVRYAEGGEGGGPFRSEPSLSLPVQPEFHTNPTLWCRMMRDFDMIPDQEEFGMDSKSLEETWAKSLAREDFIQSPPIISSTSAFKGVKPAQVKFGLRQGGISDEQNLDSIAVQSTKVEMRRAPMSAQSMFQSLPAKLEPEVVVAGDLLTQNRVPLDLLERFVESTEFMWEYPDREGERRKELKGKHLETQKYHRIITRRLCGESSIESKPSVESGSIANRDDISPSKSPPDLSISSEPENTGFRSPLLHGLAMESIIDGVSFSDDDEKPLALKAEDDIRTPTKQGTTVVMVGPLHEDYNKDEGTGTKSSKSFGASPQRAQRTRLKIFQYKIRGPATMPPLPQPTPFSSMLGPALRACRGLVPQPRQFIPKHRPLLLRSLFDVDKCTGIVQKLLEDDGFDVNKMWMAGKCKTKLRANINGDEYSLQMVVGIFANEASRLTEMEFKKQSGNRSSFLTFLELFQEKYAAHIRTMESVQ